MISFKSYLAEARGKYYYHVTFTKNVKKIMSKGIKPLETSLWVDDKGERMNKDGGIFAFENHLDAMRWAFKQNYKFKKPVSILRMKPSKDWEDDPSDEMSMGLGKALKKYTSVKPSEIIDAVEFKTPAEMGSKNPQEWEKTFSKELLK